MTKQKDIIVYIRAGQNEELRYAIRTWAKNLTFRKLCVVGGPKPVWLNPDIYIENRTHWSLMRQCYENLSLALSDDRLTPDVLILMDDVFVMHPVGTWAINYDRGSLQKQLQRAEERGTIGNTYNELVRATYDELRKNYNNPRSFEEHAPFLCNRKKMLDLFAKYPDEAQRSHLLWRSLYGNHYDIQSIYRPDIKLATQADLVPMAADVVSTNDSSFKGRIRPILEDYFPQKSRYEN